MRNQEQSGFHGQSAPNDPAFRLRRRNRRSGLSEAGLLAGGIVFSIFLSALGMMHIAAAAPAAF